MALSPEPHPLDEEVDRLLDDPQLADELREMQRQHAAGKLSTVPYDKVRAGVGLPDQEASAPEH